MKLNKNRFMSIVKSIDKDKHIVGYLLKHMDNNRLEQLFDCMVTYYNMLGEFDVKDEFDALYTMIDDWLENDEYMLYLISCAFWSEKDEIARFDEHEDLFVIGNVSNKIENIINKMHETLKLLVCDENVEVKCLVAHFVSFYEVYSRFRYMINSKPIFRNKDLIRITKVRDWVIYFNYGQDKFFLHENDDEYGLTLYRRYPVGKNRYELQCLSHVNSVKCRDINFGRFRPYYRGNTYSNIDTDKFLISLQYHGLITGYDNKRVSELQKTIEFKKKQIATLQELISKLNQEIYELRED